MITAALQDIFAGKVTNRLIATGLVTGLVFQVMEHGAWGIWFFLGNISVPIVLLYLLFQMRALGAGDIKLFSVVGSIWNVKILFATIIASFLTAAFLSLCKLLYHGNLISRLCVFGKYVRQAAAAGRLLRYPAGPQEKQYTIHFSISILIGYLIALEVAY